MEATEAKILVPNEAQPQARCIGRVGCPPGQDATSEAFHFNSHALERPDLQPRATRIVNMSGLGHALNELADPPVKAILVYNSNPGAIAPHQNAVLNGLEKLATRRS